MRTRDRTIGMVAAGAILASLIGAGDARAWVRSTTDKGTPIYWPGSCTWIFPDSGGTPDIPLSAVVATLTKSIADWQDVTQKAGCSYLVINQDPPAVGEAHLDKKNVLKFRTDKWCRPAESNSAEMCYSHTAAAITTVFYTSDLGKSDDGQIIDADIQANNIDFTFTNDPANATARAGTSIADLENTLTHELGHFQGLDHTCWDHTQATPPIDGSTGMPIPDCNDLDNIQKVSYSERVRIENATMYNYAKPGETTKRTPKPDDIAGICAIYPIAKDPKSCVRPTDQKTGGCSMGAGDSKQGRYSILFASLAVAALLLVRRRRR